MKNELQKQMMIRQQIYKTFIGQLSKLIYVPIEFNKNHLRYFGSGDIDYKLVMIYIYLYIYILFILDAYYNIKTNIYSVQTRLYACNNFYYLPAIIFFKLKTDN